MGPLGLEALSFLWGEAKDILFFILFCNAISIGFYFDFCTKFFYFDFLSTDDFLVLAVPRALMFFLW